MQFDTYRSAAPAAQQERSFKAATWALCAGGALWILHYALQLAGGFSGAPLKPGHPLFALDGALFSAAIFALDAGLCLLGARLQNRARILARAAMGLALLACASMTAGLGLYLTTQRPPGVWGVVGVIGTCLSATLLGLATRRSQALPSRPGTLLLLTGLLTFPVILLLAIPNGRGVPAFVTDELPFALSGAAWAALGLALRRK